MKLFDLISQLICPHQKIIQFLQKTTGEKIEKRKNPLDYLSYLKTYYENIIENMPGLVYWFDRQNRFLGCNKEHAQAVGFSSSKDIVGKTNYDMPWKESAPMLDALNSKVMMTGKEHEAEEVGKLATGRVATVLTKKAPLKNSAGEVIGVVGTSLDISDMKRADQLKTEFIHNMEHDIRTPIAGVVGALKILKEDEIEPERHELLELAYESARTLLDYTNNILDFATVVEGDPVVEQKFSFKTIVDDLRKMELPAAKLKALNFSVEIDDALPEYLIGDPKRIYRIMLNLISNAVKFTEQGGVSIAVRSIKREGHWLIVQVIVADTGIGIPKMQQAYIYEKFSRLSPANQGKYLGSGLGLSLVKTFIEDLNGEIEVVSEEGEGSQFVCTIPLKIPWAYGTGIGDE